MIAIERGRQEFLKGATPAANRSSPAPRSPDTDSQALEPLQRGVGPAKVHAVPEPDWTAAIAVAHAVLAAHLGLAPLRAFLAVGLTRHQVAALFRQGVMQRPRIGWYLLLGLPWQAGPAVRVGGVATCVSAAASWGLPTPPDPHPRVHVSLVRNAGRLRHSRDRTAHPAAGTDPTVHLHWAERVDPPAGWRAGILDTLLHLADCVPLDWFVAALDAALHVPRDGAPLLSAAEFDRLRRSLPHRLHGALALADPRAESCIETLLRLGLVRRGIALEPQVWLAPWCRVDLLLLGRVVVEADGAEFHDPVADALRDAELRRRGYVVLRFGYDRIVGDLAAVLAEIELVLAAL